MNTESIVNDQDHHHQVMTNTSEILNLLISFKHMFFFICALAKLHIMFCFFCSVQHFLISFGFISVFLIPCSHVVSSKTEYVVHAPDHLEDVGQGHAQMTDTGNDDLDPRNEEGW